MAAIGLLLILNGCAATKIAQGIMPEPDAYTQWRPAECRAIRRMIVKEAGANIGRPYKKAGNGPASFDCSGLTCWCYAKVGIKLPRTSAQQFDFGQRLFEGEALKPGDLVFFGGRSETGKVSHVGIVASYKPSDGSFTFIHAPLSGVELQKSSNTYYARRYLGAVRVLPD